jgi:uncharacterized membrane protein YhdT
VDYQDGTGTSTGEYVAIAVVAILYLAIIVFALYLYSRVARKAGYSPWWGVAIIVPLLNIVLILMFAFQEWPIERRLREAEARLAWGYGQPGPGGPTGYGGPPGPQQPGPPAAGP